MLRKAKDNKTRSEARFITKCLICGQNFPQHDPYFGKTENFQFFTF